MGDASITATDGHSPGEPLTTCIRQGRLRYHSAALRPLADQGDAGAQYNLGVMYDKAHGVPQNYAEALKWYRLAADQGDATAQYNLGFMYDEGQGVPQNYAEAAEVVSPRR